MSGRFGGGETIRLSFGPSASAVASHLCNLEGLACTAPSSHPDDHDHHRHGDAAASSAPLCDPNVTHAVNSDGLHVPRVLFVDGMDAFAANPWNRPAPVHAHAHDAHAHAPAAAAAAAAAGTAHTSSAAVQSSSNYRATDTMSSHNTNGSTHQEDVLLSAAFDTLNISRAEDDPRMPSKSTAGARAGAAVPTWSGSVDVHHRSNIANVGADSQSQRMDPMAMFHQAAVNLSGSGKSRYRAKNNSAHSSRFVYPPSSSFLSGGAGGGGGRHMVWDSDEEEEEEDDDGYGYSNGMSEEQAEEMRRLQERREAQRWYGEERDGYDMLVGAWGEASSHFSHHRQSQSVEGGGEKRKGSQDASLDGDHISAANSTENEKQEGPTPSAPDLAWIDYFMPPHPSVSSYAAPLPFNTPLHALGQEDRQQSMQQQAYLSSYHAGYHPSSSSGATMPGSGASLSTSWREDVLSEKIRKLLEECDAVRGFNIVVEGGGGGLLHGGLATSVLEELGDECRSAGRFCLAVDPTGEQEESRRPKLKASQFGRGLAPGAADSIIGETKMIESFRSALNSGLALHGLSSNSDLFLPISLAKSADALFGRGARTSTFQSSAAAALAIEASTLPYRLLGLRSSSTGSMTPMRSKIGIQSGFFAGSGQSDNSSDPYATAERLSFHEFMSCVKPSNRHSILSLDALITTLTGNGMSLNSALMQGTSIERRRLEAEANLYRGRHRYGGPQREVESGLWLEDRHNYGGTLSSFSPVPSSGQASIRSNHSHFALSSTYRPAGNDPSSDPAAAYTTLLMEGMALRYRPEVSVGTVVRQSIRGLTGNAGYAAGAYWKSILGNKGTTIEGQRSDVDSYVSAPILSVLGNSTRIYPHLSNTSTNFAAALSRRYAGYMSRDSMAGLAPEGEDAEEAVEACREMSDAYEPPLGSGLFVDDEGDYFSENED